VRFEGSFKKYAVNKQACRVGILPETGNNGSLAGKVARSKSEGGGSHNLDGHRNGSNKKHDSERK
jgi:hypothetical protein